MQDFSPLASKLREEIEDDELTSCKIAKIQTDSIGTEILLLIFAKLPLERSVEE